MAYLGFVPPGVVLPFAGATAPQGWLLCNGDPVSRTTYAALFAAIGVAHGYGDNSTTFHLPDYRGRIMRGRDGGIARDPDRASRSFANVGGNTGDNVGSVQTQATKTPTNAFTTASQTVTGSINNDGAHTHGIVCIGGNVAPHDGPGLSGQSPPNGTVTFNSAINTTGSSHTHGHSLSAPASTVNGGGDNETRPINAYVNYIIKI